MKYIHEMNSTNDAMIAIIESAHGTTDLTYVKMFLGHARNELNRRRPGMEGIGRDKAFGYLIQEIETAQHQEIDYGNVLDCVTDLDPEGYEDLTASMEDGSKTRKSLAWAIQELVYPALEAADAIA